MRDGDGSVVEEKERQTEVEVDGSSTISQRKVLSDEYSRTVSLVSTMSVLL